MVYTYFPMLDKLQDWEIVFICMEEKIYSVVGFSSSCQGPLIHRNQCDRPYKDAWILFMENFETLICQNNAYGLSCFYSRTCLICGITLRSFLTLIILACMESWVKLTFQFFYHFEGLCSLQTYFSFGLLLVPIWNTHAKRWLYVFLKIFSINHFLSAGHCIRIIKFDFSL